MQTRSAREFHHQGPQVFDCGGNLVIRGEIDCFVNRRNHARVIIPGRLGHHVLGTVFQAILPGPFYRAYFATGAIA